MKKKTKREPSPYIECVGNTHLDTHQQHTKCIKANAHQLCIIQAYTYNAQTKTCQTHRTCASKLYLMNPNCYSSSPQPFLLLPKLPCPNLTPDCALADSLIILMPGPHLELNIMQTWADVGGCDAWMGSYWRPNQQWWVGWHSPQNLPNGLGRPTTGS